MTTPEIRSQILDSNTKCKVNVLGLRAVRFSSFFLLFMFILNVVYLFCSPTIIVNKNKSYPAGYQVIFIFVYIKEIISLNLLMLLHVKETLSFSSFLEIRLHNFLLLVSKKRWSEPASLPVRSFDVNVIRAECQ